MNTPHTTSQNLMFAHIQEWKKLKYTARIFIEPGGAETDRFVFMKVWRGRAGGADRSQPALEYMYVGSVENMPDLSRERWEQELSGRTDAIV